MEVYSFIIHLVVSLCFYMAISYAFIAWKYIAYFKVSEALRPLLAFMHFFIVVTNISGFIFFILLDRHEPVSVIISWIGFVVAVTGSILIAWSILTLKVATFIPPSDGKLITTGPFSITAHPIYLGGVLAAFGLAIWSASTLALVYALVITLMLIIVSRVEEKKLVAKFGDSYTEYKRSTWLGRIIPAL